MRTKQQDLSPHLLKQSTCSSEVDHTPSNIIIQDHRQKMATQQAFLFHLLMALLFQASKLLLTKFPHYPIHPTQNKDQANQNLFPTIFHPNLLQCFPSSSLQQASTPLQR